MTSSLSDFEDLLKPKVLSLVYEQEFGFIKDGKSTSLGGEHDRELLINLRQRSDLIVTTAKTAEIEQYVQPKKPLVLLTTRQDAAVWLSADRLSLDNPRFGKLIKGKKVLFETGLKMSTELFRRGLIDQIVLHHDQKNFQISKLGEIGVEISKRLVFHSRYISLLERRGS